LKTLGATGEFFEAVTDKADVRRDFGNASCRVNFITAKGKFTGCRKALKQNIRTSEGNKK
jgi:hypothetical protein